MVPEEVIVHPDFTRGSNGAFLNDIALLRLGADLKFSDTVRPVCLPSFSDRAKSYKGTAEITGETRISGWSRRLPRPVACGTPESGCTESGMLLTACRYLAQEPS